MPVSKTEKPKESSEQKTKDETKGKLDNLKKEVKNPKESSEQKTKDETKGKLDNLEEEVKNTKENVDKKDKPKRKYRVWKKKYEKVLKEKGISLTKEDRENIVKNHNKKEFKRFYKEIKNAIKENKTDEFLKKRKNKGYDDLLAKLSKKDKTDSDKEKKSSHKTKNNSTESNENNSSITNNSTESNENNSSTTNNSTESNEESSKTTTEVGELAKVPESKEARMKRLFPSGTPKSKEEMEKYLTKIEMPVRTSDGKEDKLELNVHEKLAEEIKAIFKEMYDKNIPVNPKKTGAFCWRKVRRGNSMSQHSYGSAIDVNYNVNGGVYGKTDKSSPYYNGSETVAIRKKHGFFRGGDWSAKSDDPMHFGFYNG